MPPGGRFRARLLACGLSSLCTDGSAALSVISGAPVGQVRTGSSIDSGIDGLQLALGLIELFQLGQDRSRAAEEAVISSHALSHAG